MEQKIQSVLYLNRADALNFNYKKIIGRGLDIVFLMSDITEKEFWNDVQFSKCRKLLLPHVKIGGIIMERY